MKLVWKHPDVSVTDANGNPIEVHTEAKTFFRSRPHEGSCDVCGCETRRRFTRFSTGAVGAPSAEVLDLCDDCQDGLREALTAERTRKRKCGKFPGPTRK